MKKKMKPTVRLELQLDRRRIEQTFGFPPSLSTILQKEVLVEVWDRLLQTRGLDNPILNQSQLYKLECERRQPAPQKRKAAEQRLL